MKKFVTLLLVLALALSAVAALADTAKVAVICDPVGVNPFLTQVVEKAQELQATYGYELRILECSDTDKWQSSYDAAVAEEYDLILGVGWQSAEYAAAKAEEADGIAFAVSYIAHFALYLKFAYDYPQQCSMNFRYITVTLVFNAAALAARRGRKHRILTAAAAVFCALSAAMTAYWSFC